MEKYVCPNCKTSTEFLVPYNPKYLVYCPNRAKLGYIINDKFIEQGETKRYGIVIKEPYTCNKCGYIVNYK